MAVDTNTTDPSYWLNWRFLVSALLVLGIVIFSLYLIWKHEGKRKSDGEVRECRQVPDGVLYKDELLKTCLKCIHPIWLLLFRILAFGVLLALIVGNTVADGPGIFYFYTQWTFTITTLYFGLASAFSIVGFCQNCDRTRHITDASPNIDAELGSNVVPKTGSSHDAPNFRDTSNHGEVHVRQTAGFIGYLFQILYQVVAGAVILTDIVYWLVLYAIFTPKNSKLEFFNVCMHTVNVLILGDTVLNCMRFPMFRIAYFILWTSTFVVCQWIIHAFISIRWPYPFMDLSPPYAPLWYAAIGLLLVLCFGFFALVVKLKHVWLSRSFSDSYQGLR
ncbi:hypothetical protein RND81_11G018800 [Saponaria officinalis]|uniref:Uncharacterized protein n=1 Tax=Saponaria officinalis TaxID=3572 RepID=A0AAW1HGU9_SAPOF